MSEEIVITCKITSIRPYFDAYGNEFVCVEFGVEAQKPPTVMSMPQNLPSEMSFVMPILTQIPKILPQTKLYNNRLILFLTTLEWEKLVRKYQYGDEVEIRVGKDGTLRLVPIKV